MSYSFSVYAPSQRAALCAVTAELAKVVCSQPVHAADAAQTLRAVEEVVSTLPDVPSAATLYVSVSGSLWAPPGTAIGASASLNVSANIG